LGEWRKGLSRLKLLTSCQQNLSGGEIKVSPWRRKVLQGLMRVLALQMNLTSGESKNTEPEMGLFRDGTEVKRPQVKDLGC
jgi:hypothetical protein